MSWVDAVKGLAVILVVYAHALPSSSFEDVISTFHVPLFIVITGYLIGDKEYTKDEAIQRYSSTFKRNIQMYIIYSVVAVFVTSLIKVLLHDFTVSFIFQNIYASITGYGGSYSLWYVASYLMGLGLFYAIRCNVHDKKARWLIALLLLIPAILYDYCFREYTDYLYLISYPMISILRSATFIFYFEIGTYAKRLLKKVNWKTELISIVMFFSVIIIAISNGYTNYSFLVQGKYPLALYYCGAVGSVAVIASIRFIYQKYHIRFLEKAGENSLLIMSTHMNWGILFFTQIVINHCIFRLPEKQDVTFYLYGIFCVGMVLFIEYLMIFLLNGIKKRRKTTFYI